MSDMTFDAASALFSYDKLTGVLTWKKRPESDFKSKNSWSIWNNRFSGKEAGTVCFHGYVVISIYGKKIKAHRIAFLLEHGYCPDVIDHINGIRTDNRAENLRPASHSQNNKNRSIDGRNRSGAKGVSWHRKASKWQVHVVSDGVKHYLGLFKTIDEAKAVRDEFAKQKHGEYFSSGVNRDFA